MFSGVSMGPAMASGPSRLLKPEKMVPELSFKRNNVISSNGVVTQIGGVKTSFS